VVAQEAEERCYRSRLISKHPTGFRRERHRDYFPDSEISMMSVF
jgi:hypothetical protein